MAGNQPSWPRRWLMTDERISDRLWEAVDLLPADGGIVFRHYRLDEARRLALGLELAERARSRGLLLAVAGSSDLAERLGAALVHNPDRSGPLPISVAVHNEEEARAARKACAALAFIAPVYQTRSHPGGRALGLGATAHLAKLAAARAIALGGMNEARFDKLDSAHPGVFHGYAGIDCWLKT